MRMLKHIYNIYWEDHMSNDSIREDIKIEKIGLDKHEKTTTGKMRRKKIE